VITIVVVATGIESICDYVGTQSNAVVGYDPVCRPSPIDTSLERRRHRLVHSSRRAFESVREACLSTPMKTRLTGEWPNLGEWRQVRPRPFVRQNLVKKSLRNPRKPVSLASTNDFIVIFSPKLLARTSGAQIFCTPPGPGVEGLCRQINRC